MITKKKLMAALLFPIICLALLTVYKGVKVMSGRELVVPITGFDPRDLLSGHYLIYRLDIDTSRVCINNAGNDVLIGIDKKKNGKLKSYPVLNDNIDRYRGDYDIILRGRCRNGRFVAGVEKFFIPEEHAGKLDKVVRKGKGKLILSVDYNGKATIRDLLINDKPWRDYVNE